MPSLALPTPRRRPTRAAAWVLLLCAAATLAGGACAAPRAPRGDAATPADALPTRLSSAEFWRLVSDVSEPGGYFRIEDNYTSNEMEIGRLHAMLRAEGVRGGVFVGVGPEQNFTYISAIRPAMAFIVDIRRQAVMQHLMYKAMFELARDRADFVSLLFAKPRPAGLDETTPIATLWDRYAAVPSDSALAARNWTRVVERLTREHGFTFTPEESAQLRSVFDAFHRYGPGITTRGAAARGRGMGFSDLTGGSLDDAGVPQSFLSTEEHYRTVKALHERNLIVPVSGDFAGPKAIRAIGEYVRARGARVSAFYVSNVEQYLFMDGKARAFYDNVATLPVDSASVFIRPYSLRRGFIVRFLPGASGAPAPSPAPGAGDMRPLCPIAAFLGAVVAGRMTSNAEATACQL